MKKRKIDVPFEVKSIDETGYFTGYASVFDEVDSHGDIVKKGAFTKSLQKKSEQGRKLPILWQHDPANPIGVYERALEDSYGLYVEGQLLIDDVVQAKEAHALMKAGAVTGLSIGFYLEDYDVDKSQGFWNLTEIDLFEVSTVTFPSNDRSRVIDVKSKLDEGELPTLKEFEKFLREAGFSKTQATAIANHGLSKLHKEQSESVSVLDGVLSILK